eukprot:3368247-Pyramimonas_sp.AAC.1
MRGFALRRPLREVQLWQQLRMSRDDARRNVFAVEVCRGSGTTRVSTRRIKQGKAGGRLASGAPGPG